MFGPIAAASGRPVTIIRSDHQVRAGSLVMVRRRMALWFPVFALLLSLFPVPSRAEENTLEQFNKAMYDFNQKYYTNSGNGATQFFSDTVPEDVRRGLTNFFANLGEPVVAFSSLAQGDVDNAGIAAHRFFYNLVFGYGGVYDRATEIGVRSAPRDLGQAVCTAGIPDGPYLVLPFYGPSSVGDFFGSALPVLAGYVALGEAFWLYRASSKVASSMSGADGAGPDGSGKEGASGDVSAAEAARREETYRLDKARYLAAREATCGKHQPPAAERAPAPGSAVTPAAAKTSDAVLASVPR